MRTNQKRTEMLYDFAKRIAAKSDLDDVLYAGAFHIAATLNCRSLILMPDAAGDAAAGAGLSLDRGRPRSARRRRRPLGLRQERAGRRRHADAADLAMDVRAARHQRRRLASSGCMFADPRRGADPEVRRLLKAVEDQVAVAVERTRLAADLQNLRVEAEGEKLRTALLNSLSHDLRTPLVSVIGALLRPQRRPAAGRPRGADRGRARRGQAARPLRAEPAQHDAARIRRAAAQAQRRSICAS